MKILSVVESLDHGGAQTVLVDLVLGLPEHEHRVVHFSSANRIEPNPQFLREMRFHGIECHDIHWEELSDPVGRKTGLAEFRPEVVLFHWWGNDPLQEWIASLLDSRVNYKPSFVCILHRHGVRAPYHYDRYVLVSQTQFDQVRHLEFRRVAYIPNGVNVNRFRGRPRKSSNDEFVIGRLSTLGEHKIEEEWPRQLASFEVPKARFVIAGHGELLPRLRASALSTRIGDKFSFPGYVPRMSVPDVLQQFDVFCYSTSTAVECHPLALLEALASGMPIVAQARGGITEIVQHGINGLLARSTAEIGESLRRLQRDTELRARLVVGALKSARTFSHDRQLNRYRDLLVSLEAERSRRSRPRV